MKIYRATRPKNDRIGEGEELQLKGTENILNKIIKENFPNLKKDKPMEGTRSYRSPNRLNQKSFLSM